ncbi:MAG: RNA polymerase sigma factor [Mangrovibacterium sp.]
MKILQRACMTEVNPTQDKMLVSALRKNNPKAFDALFRKYAQSLYLFVYSILKDDFEAEEAVQSIFMKIWEKRHALNSDLSFKSYLFTIALNITRKYYRKKALELRYKQELAIELQAGSESELTVMEYRSLLDYVEELIGKLTPARREIFLLSKKEGLKNAEIARKLKISEQTVKNQLTKARSFLLSQAEKDGRDSLMLFFMFFNMN